MSARHGARCEGEEQTGEHNDGGGNGECGGKSSGSLQRDACEVALEMGGQEGGVTSRLRIARMHRQLIASICCAHEIFDLGTSSLGSKPCAYTFKVTSTMLMFQVRSPLPNSASSTLSAPAGNLNDQQKTT
jgi:hypothetical protein